jgi:Fe-S-cluster-containing dehydrogenase component
MNSRVVRPVNESESELKRTRRKMRRSKKEELKLGFETKINKCPGCGRCICRCWDKVRRMEIQRLESQGYSTDQALKESERFMEVVRV